MADRVTIDELARKSGLTTRNIRAYQTRGLLPGPEIHGRTGFYGEDHLARIQIIRDMQAAGFNLEAIKRMLDLMPAGSGEEVLRFERTLLSPWVTEEPEIVEGPELLRRFPDSTAETLQHAEELGVVRHLGDGRFEVPTPSLLRAGEEAVRFGIPLEDTLQVLAEVERHADGVARSFVQLFIDRVWRPFDEAGRPPEDLPRVREALERLRPMASTVLQAAFQRMMSREVETAFGEQLSRAPAEKAG